MNDNDKADWSARVYLVLAGLAGALVSLAHLEGLSKRQKVAAVAAGTLTATFVGPYATEQIGLGSRGSAALHFALGLGGLILTGLATAFFRALRENPAATLGEVLKRIGGKGD